MSEWILENWAQATGVRRREGGSRRRMPVDMHAWRFHAGIQYIAQCDCVVSASLHIHRDREAEGERDIR